MLFSFDIGPTGHGDDMRQFYETRELCNNTIIHSHFVGHRCVFLRARVFSFATLTCTFSSYDFSVGYLLCRNISSVVDWRLQVSMVVCGDWVNE